jgi:hypothetical protein
LHPKCGRGLTAGKAAQAGLECQPCWKWRVHRL